MKTIYLSLDDFNSFLASYYFVVLPKHLNPKSNNHVHIECSDLAVLNKKSILFLSKVKSISLPDAKFIPQLRTLYGLPSGLLTSRNENIIFKSRKNKLKLKEHSSEDLIYQTFRRALLYMQVWSIKEMDISIAEEKFRQIILSSDKIKNVLLTEIVSNVAKVGGYPQFKPNSMSIDDSVLDYQLFWLGKLISTVLLNGEKMDAKCREWFLECDVAQPETTCEFLKPYNSFIIGYVIALKVHNKGKNDIQTLLSQIDKGTYINHPLKLDILSYSLFFIGLIENKADKYYMTTVALGLFELIEKASYDFAFNSKFILEEEIQKSFTSIKETFLNPIENCVNFYKIKNPDLINPLYYRFVEENGKYPDATPVVQPERVVEFLRHQKMVNSINLLLSDKLLIISNRKLYDSLLFSSYKVLFYDEVSDQIEFNKFAINFKTEIYTDSEKLINSENKFFSKLQKIDELMPVTKNEWLLIAGDYKINPAVIEMLRSISLKNYPTRIYVFNFVKPKVTNIQTELFDDNIQLKNNSKNNKKNNNKFSNSNTNETQPQLNNASLQSELVNVFPFAKVNIVSTIQYESPWEMVNLGIGLLQHTKLCNTTIFETRTQDFNTVDYITIARCFSDIIIYDVNQKYLFLNL